MNRGSSWPIAMASILAATVGANIWVAVIASGDPSFAVEKDYYAKAVAWDSVLAERDRNVELGWHIASRLDGFDAARGARLTVSLTDSSGADVTGAKVHVAAIYNARAGAILEATLRPDSSGGYTAQLPMRHAGLWELRFEISRGTERFTAASRIEAAAEGP